MSKLTIMPNIIRQVAIMWVSSSAIVREAVRRNFTTIINPSLFFEINANREVSNYAV